jgi:SAM-dependent methyltransferase
LTIGEGRSTSRFTDPAYLRFQYSDDERLRVRIRTHERYSENALAFADWLAARLDGAAGQRLLDIGAGTGHYHSRLTHLRIVAIDLSPGMLTRLRAPKLRADAQRLPFRERTFERVLCAFVLFHVPDIELALREMRRVVATGGRVVIATNSRQSMRPLFELLGEIDDELGIAHERSVGLRFGLEDVPTVRGIFPNAEVQVYEDAFRFTRAEPVLAYVASMSVGLLPEETRWKYLCLLAERVEAIIKREGAFRVPKRSGCFVVDM